MNNKKGFTLVELLAVIVVLGIVASIGIYAITNSIKKAKEKSYQVTINEIERSANDYLLENSGSIPFVSDGDETEYQCVTIKNLMDGGHFKNNITKSLVGKDTYVNPDDFVIIKRNKNTKVISTITYFRSNNSEIKSKCEAATNIISSNNDNNTNDNNDDNNNDNNNTDNNNNNNPIATQITASDFNYTGEMQFVNEDNDNWYIKFLTSGTLTVARNIDIEAFLVGGGGAGGIGVAGTTYKNGTNAYGAGGGGGGGGYRTTDTMSVIPGTNYIVTIGTGGTTSGASGSQTSIKVGDSIILSADGGAGGGYGSNDVYKGTGGAGGTGGSSGGTGAVIGNSGNGYSESVKGSGGAYAFGSSTYGRPYGAGGGGGGARSGDYTLRYGANGGDYSGENPYGSGGGPTSAGNAGGYYGAGGGGGGSDKNGGNGYQGIIIIRNVR